MRAGRGGIGCGSRDSDFKGTAALGFDVPGKGGCELFLCFADQVDFCNSRKEFRERCDAARFRLAAGNPVDGAIEGGERLLGGFGVGRLGIVDEDSAPDAADFFKPVRQAGEAAQPIGQTLGCPDRAGARRICRINRGAGIVGQGLERAQGGKGCQCILDVVAAAQCADAFEVGDLFA